MNMNFDFNVMTIVTFAFIYILVWWIVIFCVLPWGNAPIDKDNIGFASSAPKNPRMKLKLVLTTLISFLVTGILYAVSIYTGFSVFDIVAP